MKKQKDHIDATLFLRIIENRADDNDKHIFQDWIDSSDEKRDLFNQLKKLHQMPLFSQDSIQLNWEEVVRKYRNEHNVPDYIQLPQERYFSMSKTVKMFVRVAAVLIIVLGVTLLIKNIVFEPEQLIVSSIELNAHEPFQLPDGSMVYLNESAELLIPKDFGADNRNLTLKGEAFFEVRKNPEIPFKVTCCGTVVKVLGTSFNVNSNQSGMVNVSVLLGIVEFYSDKRNLVTLTVNERGIYNRDLEKIEKTKFHGQNFLAWKTGVLNFDETPVSEVLRLLEKQYSSVFVFENLPDHEPTITTTFDNQSKEAVLEELDLLLNTNHVFKNDTIFFKQNN